MDDNSNTSMSEVIAMTQQAGVLDGETAGMVTEKIGGMTVGQIGVTKFALAKQLGDMPKAFATAGALLDFMRDAELIGLPTAAPQAPSGPLGVTVNMPTARRDMGLGQLFEELDSHPEDAAELITLINAQPSVIAANAKLQGSGEWAITNTDGTLNVEETRAYVSHLAARRSQPQIKWKGQYWPTTLERALGIDQRVMVYPFALAPDQILFDGVDRFSNDWRRLSDDVHEALIAAVGERRLVAGDETEVRRLTYDVFAPELPRYLMDIVEEYAERKRRGDKVERYATEEQIRRSGLDGPASGGRPPFGRKPERDDAWYKARLREVAMSPIHESMASVRKSQCVLTSVHANMGSVSLHEVIVLEGVLASMGSLSGTIYLPSGVSATTGLGSNRAHVYNMSWKRLYEKAVQLGIIEE